jgi:creatinine amidohydrolase
MQLANMKWPEIAALSKDTPVVFPIAALEQHGHHMPLFTDSLLLGAIIERVAAELNREVLFAPLTWLGNSDHHLDFVGTLSAPPRVYLDSLAGLCENFIQHGFKRLVFINGHGGNDVPGKQATFEVRQKHRDRADLLILFGTYWTLADPTKESRIKFAQHEMGHACEWETSMMLRIRPELVDDYAAAAPVEFGNPFQPGFRAWITRDRTKPGHIGSPHLATAEKGEELLRIFSGGVSAFLRRVVAWDGQSWNG